MMKKQELVATLETIKADLSCRPADGEDSMPSGLGLEPREGQRGGDLDGSCISKECSLVAE